MRSAAPLRLHRQVHPSTPPPPARTTGAAVNDAPTSCVVSRTVHHCPCVADTVAHGGWDLQWLPLPAGERRYSTDCFAKGLSAPGQGPLPCKPLPLGAGSAWRRAPFGMIAADEGHVFPRPQWDGPHPWRLGHAVFGNAMKGGIEAIA